MPTMTTDPIVEEYLRRLDSAAASLPRHRRAELLSEIREHVDNALLETDADDEVAVRNVLERLGAPEEIVSAAEPATPAVGRTAGLIEIAALVAMVVPFVGWLFGIVLVLVSQAWSAREKVIGVVLAVLPALLPVLGLAGGGLGSIEVIFLGLAGLPSAIYLGTRLRSRSRTAI
jgi:uncharacterized membrane protein